MMNFNPFSWFRKKPPELNPEERMVAAAAELNLAWQDALLDPKFKSLIVWIEWPNKNVTIVESKVSRRTIYTPDPEHHIVVTSVEEGDKPLRGTGLIRQPLRGRTPSK